MKEYKSKPKEDDKKSKEDTPDVCNGCLRWEKFGKNCYVYWDGKKHCTRKVFTMEEWAKKEIIV
jgi:hypothetical protein